MKSLKLHIGLLILLALPCLMLPLALWSQTASLIPENLGILGTLYIMLWGLHSAFTTLITLALLILRRLKTVRPLLYTHLFSLILLSSYFVWLIMN